jgi:hypothetical protein
MNLTSDNSTEFEEEQELEFSRLRNNSLKWLSSFLENFTCANSNGATLIQVPILPKVTNSRLHIFVITNTGNLRVLHFVTFNQYGLEGQVFWQSFCPIF